MVHLNKKKQNRGVGIAVAGALTVDDGNGGSVHERLRQGQLRAQEELDWRRGKKLVAGWLWRCGIDRGSCGGDVLVAGDSRLPGS